MADVEFPPKYTRRSVSAVRQWPRGCGRIVAAPSRPAQSHDLAIAVLIPPPPEPSPEPLKIQEVAIEVPGGDDTKPAMLGDQPGDSLDGPDSSSAAPAAAPAPEKETEGGDSRKRSLADFSSAAPAAAPEEEKEGGDSRKRSVADSSSEAPAAAPEEEKEGGDSRKRSVEEDTVCMDETPKPAKDYVLENFISPAVAEPPPPPPNGASAEERCFSKLYPPPKRTRVSAVRQFPPGCGRNASVEEEDSRRRKKMMGDPGIAEVCGAQEGNSSKTAARRSSAKDADSRKPAASRKGAKSSSDAMEKDDSFVADDDGVPSQGDEATEAAGERVVVQALMASQTCPWRHPQRRSVAASASSSSAKKVAILKTRTRRCSSRGISILHPKNTIATPINLDEDEDEEDGEDSNKTLVVYSGSSAGGSEASFRHRVKRALRMFQAVFRRLTQDVVSKKLNISRIDLEASNVLKKNKEYVHQGTKIIGSVPGVEVGDEFHYRVELAVVGLHGPLQGGIDHTDLNGVKVAISVVSSGGYPNNVDGSNVLVYTGSGGAPVSDKQGSDQKLERGNMALKNSIDAGNPVRVIYGCKEKIADHRDSRAKLMSTFTYDGLYLVERFWQELGPHGFHIYKYQLRRQPGQPETGKKEARNSKVREGLVLKDVSNGKEIMPIPVVNTFDGELPPTFDYTTEVIYPDSHARLPQATGCDCVGGCSDSHKCACTVKNGGELPFNSSGAIVQAKRLVYECGPACGCPPSCQNRVSQKGIRIPLEIFKTASKGWGVRSLQSIASGSFICEYTGEMLRDEDSEKRINDEYLFDIGNNYEDNKLWEGIPTLSTTDEPREESGPPAAIKANKDEDGYTLDAADHGNVGRFINHSCSPNLYAQNVLYDDDDKRTPHIMLFATDNIPPLQELTYHYNYGIDQVRDSHGNIKKKNCYCGASDCEGRLY